MHHFELSSYFLDRIASINDSQKSIFSLIKILYTRLAIFFYTYPLGDKDPISHSNYCINWSFRYRIFQICCLFHYFLVRAIKNSLYITFFN